MANKGKYQKKQDTRDIYGRALIYVLLVYVPFFTLLNLLRLWGFGFGIGDLGVFNQIIHNTAEGNFFQTSLKYPYSAEGNWLGFHFMILPIIFAAAFYYIFPHIEVLSFLHVALVSFTAIVIYKTCLKLNLSAAWSFFWAVIYLSNLMTLYHALFSFQEASFAVLLMALGFYFTISKNFKALAICCLLLILTKEQYGLTCTGFGILWALYHNEYKRGAAMAAFGIFTFIAVMFFIIPYYSPYDAHFMLAKGADTANYARYIWLTNPPLEVIKLLPEKIFNLMNGRYMLGLLLPLLLLPLGAIILLLPIAPDIAITLLSDSPHQKLYIYYYSAPLMPALIIAAAITLNKIKLRRNVAVLMLLANLIVAVMVLKTPVGKLGYFTDGGMDWSYGVQFKEALQNIPEDKWLLVEEFSAVPASARRLISTIEPETLKKADYTLIRISPYKFTPFNNFADDAHLILAKHLLKQDDWGLAYWKYPYAVFKRNATDNASRYELEEILKRYSDYIIQSN